MTDAETRHPFNATMPMTGQKDRQVAGKNLQGGISKGSPFGTQPKLE